MATDLSARSDRAVLRSVKLAAKFNASLTILHVIDNEIPENIIKESKKLALEEINFCLKYEKSKLKIDIDI